MGITDKKYGYKATPQVSANQMAEYLLATSSGRKRVIQAARFPKRSVVAQYGKAREGLVTFLADGTRNLRHLADATDYLARRGEKADASDWLKRDSRQSVEAIIAFQNAYNRLGVKQLDCRLITSRLPMLDEWPTKISVNVDVEIHVPTIGGRDRIGAAILLFSRGEASSARRIEQSKTIASLILQFCSRFMAERGDPDKKLCLAIDIFGGRSHGPQGVRKMDHIRDACEEIATRWPSVAPPPDYDGPEP
jgi:hypothetical protein